MTELAPVTGKKNDIEQIHSPLSEATAPNVTTDSEQEVTPLEINNVIQDLNDSCNNYFLGTSLYLKKNQGVISAEEYKEIIEIADKANDVKEKNKILHIANQRHVYYSLDSGGNPILNTCFTAEQVITKVASSLTFSEHLTIAEELNNAKLNASNGLKTKIRLSDNLSISTDELKKIDHLLETFSDVLKNSETELSRSPQEICSTAGIILSEIICRELNNENGTINLRQTLSYLNNLVSNEKGNPLLQKMLLPILDDIYQGKNTELTTNAKTFTLEEYINYTVSQNGATAQKIEEIANLIDDVMAKQFLRYNLASFSQTAKAKQAGKVLNNIKELIEKESPVERPLNKIALATSLAEEISHPFLTIQEGATCHPTAIGFILCKTAPERYVKIISELWSDYKTLFVDADANFQIKSATTLFQHFIDKRNVVRFLENPYNAKDTLAVECQLDFQKKFMEIMGYKTKDIQCNPGTGQSHTNTILAIEKALKNGNFVSIAYNEILGNEGHAAVIIGVKYNEKTKQTSYELYHGNSLLMKDGYIETIDRFELMKRLHYAFVIEKNSSFWGNDGINYQKAKDYILDEQSVLFDKITQLSQELEELKNLPNNPPEETKDTGREIDTLMKKLEKEIKPQLAN